MLREHPEIKTYADASTHFVSYQRENHDTMKTNMNSKLQAIHDWDHNGNSDLPNKPQASYIHHSHEGQNLNDHHPQSQSSVWTQTVV